VGALLGDEVLIGSPGDLIFKPRHQWHTFWNAGDEPARILEIISPAGFEQFFSELVDLGGVTRAEPEVLADLRSLCTGDGSWERSGASRAIQFEVPGRANLETEVATRSVKRRTSLKLAR
jgi:hypothetical protein